MSTAAAPGTGPRTLPRGGRGPLAGCRVVDLTANMTGPFATMMLADQGADVIKVEPPGGEVIRRVGTGRAGATAYFANLNRSKRSIVVNLRDEAGVDLVRRLIRSADVFVQNFRPGVIEDIGLGPHVVCADLPSLVYVSINGFGTEGPQANMPAYDHVVQALSGMADRQADLRGGPPGLVRHGVVDKATGLTVAQAITAALLARAGTGRGAQIEVSMLDVALNFLWPDGMMNHTCLDPVDELPPIASGFRLTATADGYVAMITVTDQQWRALIDALGLVNWLNDPDLSSVQGRMRNGGRVMREVAAKLAKMPTDDVVERMQSAGVPCMPVVKLDAVRKHPQVVARHLVEETVHPKLGRIVQPMPPVRFIRDEEPSRWPAPEAGADTEAVLSGVGFSAPEIEGLRQGGVVA